MTQLLIEHGTYLENKDSQGYTPFLKAIDMKSDRVMNLLADGGANINAKDAKGRNALQIALDMNDLQLYKQVQDIMALGQQPSQYQPSQPQTQRRPAENVGNVSGDDELIKIENKTSKKERIKDKDLSLVFVGDGHGNPTVYKLFWDAQNNWFGYKDVTVHPAAPEPDSSDYEPEYEPQYEPPHYEEQSAGPVTTAPTATDELFYPEEEVIVGS